MDIKVEFRIANCEEKIRMFCEHDAYLRYDRPGIESGRDPNVICKEDLDLMNSGMMARSKVEAWRPFFGSRGAELGELLSAVPRETDLVDSSDSEYQYARDQLRNVYTLLTGAPWITDMAASKMLYLKRPRLVAISDSYIRKLLWIADSQAGLLETHRGDYYATRGLSVMDAVRTVGRQNTEALGELQRNIYALELNGKPVTLSKARIIDILLWTTEAVK